MLCYNQKIEGFFSNFLFIIDSGSICIKIFLSFFCIPVFIVIWKNFVIQKLNFFEYFSVYFFSLISLFLILNTFDLISFYLVVEMQALCFYILTSFKKRSFFSTEAGIKYFILGSFISGLFLLGCLLVYATLGTTNFQNLFILLPFFFESDFWSFLNFFLFNGILLIIITLLFKIVVAPFHFWAPDVYEGAPLASTIIFSLLPKISLFVFFIRWLSLCLPNFTLINTLLIVTGLFSVFWGSFLALTQKRFKRFLIYSSISQVGFLIIAASIYSLESFSNLFFFLIVYLFSSLVLWNSFTFLTNNNYQLSIFEKNIYSRSVFLIDFTSLFRSNYTFSVAILIVFFSFAGIPPFIGFLSKILIIFNLVSEHMFIYTVILVLLSAVSSYYYMRIIKIMFFEKNKKLILLNAHSFFDSQISELDSIFYIFCLFFLILLFFFPTIILLVSNVFILGFFAV